jgi:hypothetical protein
MTTNISCELQKLQSVAVRDGTCIRTVLIWILHHHDPNRSFAIVRMASRSVCADIPSKNLSFVRSVRLTRIKSLRKGGFWRREMNL